MHLSRICSGKLDHRKTNNAMNLSFLFIFKLRSASICNLCSQFNKVGFLFIYTSDIEGGGFEDMTLGARITALRAICNKQLGLQITPPWFIPHTKLSFSSRVLNYLLPMVLIIQQLAFSKSVVYLDLGRTRCLWTEWCESVSEISTSAWAHLCLMLLVMWTPILPQAKVAVTTMDRLIGDR